MMKRFIPLLLLAGVMIVAYYFIFSNEEWNDEGSLSKGFLSEEQKYLESLTEKEIQKQVFYTMPLEVLKPQFGGKVFCASEIFGFNVDPEDLILDVYLWGYCEEYYIKGETITLGTGVSEPIKLAFKNDGKRLTFDSVITPKDGDEYENSIRVIFPEEHVKQALEGVDTKQMVPSPKTQADNYYTGKLEVYF
ncbi:MAG: hypothetical protein US95_C0001G0026 [Candidatus Woesebacteria bacterium GW2011_GWB1_38_5]|uniref:Uncharacterized protein n=4 Tax=Candidatus Woeseibacteriota TaxID=1752722 RepID=A0A0G0KJB5_9BACT|nr:MAG: hypothetical protein US67_C0003G0010 [Candidatus Woesebacteria bacterium GW2011_GWD1_38_10]KKQ56951.1 MAG: hypothetical protein US75_C0001G0008 [Candidatus Woesebacteria bacterium GW2011_GWC1_38_13]KKQ75595.1 MAG: hypothetical protein US95_C0001G0026 [Candidatus Woesebacteria bacterium GW2011_GWB1_38_5]KKQ84541.1 MAG: hypothetical protein UT06_C0003G0014 [Candidatus Woesebacteria bacterium GW2011_GWA1_38_8]